MTSTTPLSEALDTATTAVVLIDLQNDFLHPDGAYGRAGVGALQPEGVVPRLVEVTRHARSLGMMTVATSFTLAPGRDGEPIISPHLAALRPFLARGDFEPGGWGHRTVDELLPIDSTVEKVAYSAFHQSRLEHVLRRSGISTLVVGGIVTNGGVASTVRDAHVRDFDVVVLSDGCAAFDVERHDIAVRALDGTVARAVTCAEFLDHRPNQRGDH